MISATHVICDVFDAFFASQHDSAHDLGLTRQEFSHEFPGFTGLHMLPQAPEEAAYYTYGTPSAGRGQYAHPNMLSFLFHLEFRWSLRDDRKLAIGNISLADRTKFPDHGTHGHGLDVDIRPIRKDGKRLPVRYQDAVYDRDATRRLVELIWQSGMAKLVYFNDPALTRVTRMPKHDNHLHISIKA
ncbi:MULTISPECIES: penicillin-insensitive murein endopeptidase [Cupriavidus]|uniref:Penicillin-insensitive murein endopeptidase n=1 Tax=Cupriavidus campinensis TaxID=151783 RepID=A0AAE9L2M5_9BURK|nr:MULTISPECIES: penicillin-insensitive murein endopeptidase [Cupriavidus]URF04170.1 penicillin-insensitive murein endopeptidase [Cupriavidus campinensis]